VSAYRIARDVTGAVARWEALEALVGRIEPALLDDLMAGTDRLVEITSRWYLQHVPGQLGRAIAAHAEPFHMFVEAIPAVAPEAWRHERERVAWRLMDRGVPEDVAHAHALQPFLVHGPDVVSVAAATGRPVPDVTRAFFLVGEAAYVDWLEHRLTEVGTTTRWHRWALQALEDDLLRVRRELAERALSERAELRADEAVAAYLEQRADVASRLGRFMRGLALEEASDLAALTVAVRQVRALIG
jgi:glutamate dehydrogenase